MGDVRGTGPTGLPVDRSGVECGDVCPGDDGDRDLENAAGGADPDHELYVDRPDDDAGTKVVPPWLGGLDAGHDEAGAGFLAIGPGGVESVAASGLFLVGSEFGDVWVGCGF